MLLSCATYIDLTHNITPTISTWDGRCGFECKTLLDYNDNTTDVKFCVQRFKLLAGIGTHMDAPAHCFFGAQTIDQLDITTFIVPCVVIDARDRTTASYSVTLQDIQRFEYEHGTIPAKSLVAVNTGWDRFWPNARAYHNNHHFPSVTPEAAHLLVERNIVGLAIDTLSVDRPESGYPVHAILLNAGLYIIENATNLDKLPPIGAHILALPIKVQGATEAPIRFIGIIPQAK
jgi:kynurenine formamidase